MRGGVGQRKGCHRMVLDRGRGDASAGQRMLRRDAGACKFEMPLFFSSKQRFNIKGGGNRQNSHQVWGSEQLLICNKIVIKIEYGCSSMQRNSI